MANAIDYIKWRGDLTFRQSPVNEVDLFLFSQLSTLDYHRFLQPEEEMTLAEAAKHERSFVIGGESVYRLLFPYLTRIYVTKIGCAPESDAFFPDLDADPAWKITDAGEEKEQDGIPYRFMTYERV